MDFKTELKMYQDIVNKELEKYIRKNKCIEKVLNSAMEYSLMAGGKRLRPILVIATYKLFKENIEECMPYAVAIEMVHNFSLIHDDLPGIDNDDFRHGKPTNHKKFNEATAILAGDGLLNNAYMVISNDLRNTKLKDNLILRAKVLQYLRSQMIEQGFLEVQTPVLTSSSPEGARDYLVPSRLHPGKFYALPQAPQQFKQLLMVSGIDKYFQIAPCFRDEDARADRCPGEFYQLDMEMSYATQEDVFSVIEPVMYNTFKTFSNKKVAQYPFPRIPYREAMVKYGSDKPDLRNPLFIIDLTDFFQKCTFKPFYNKAVRAIKVTGHMSKGFHEKMLEFAKSIGMGGLGYLEVQEDLSYKGPIDKFIPDDLKKQLLELADLKVNDTIFFIADDEPIANILAGQIRTELGKRLNLIDENVFSFCWIVDFPMYELNEHGKLDFCHNPFSMPQGGLEALKTQQPLDILAYQYDIVCNGIELSSGAVRNHDPEIMIKAFELVGYSKEHIEEKFRALFNAFQYGAPPHAGIAPGVDRMLMLLTNSETVRDVIAFPMNSKSQDLLMGAPNTVTKEQLQDVHIKLDLPETQK